MKNDDDCNCSGNEALEKRKKTLQNPAVRMSYCHSCEKKRMNPLVGPTCGILAIPEWKDGKMIACGCILKIKTKMKSAQCPQGKW
jgi:hypothetical protein